MSAGFLPRSPDLRRHPLASRNEIAKRAERRRLRQTRFEQAVIDRRHTQQHAWLEARHCLGDGRRGGPALEQDVACAHAERCEHVADRIGKVKARGGEQPVVLRAAQDPLVIPRAHADIAVMMLDRLRRAGRSRGHHPERRIARLARHRNKRRGGRRLPRGEIVLAADHADPRQGLGNRGHGNIGELAIDHQSHRPDNAKNLLKLLGVGAARDRRRDGPYGHRGKMGCDNVGRIEH